MIKTLKDLNQAGKRFWSRPNRDDAGKKAQADAVHPMTKHNAPPGMEKCPNCGGYGRKYGEPCDVCHGKGFVPEGSADSAKDASIQSVARAVAQEVMSMGEKIKEIERRTGCTTEQAKQALAAVDSARDFSTTAEIEAAAKKAKAAGKSKEEFVSGYSGGAAETAARVW